MKKIIILLLPVLCLPFLFGCADKQEEAEKLEQEMLAEPGPSVDTSDIDTTDDTIRSLSESALAPSDADAVSEESVTMPRRPIGEGYTVQVAASETEEYAVYLIDLYTERGYEPYVTEFWIGGEQHYRVRIGLFETYSEAEALRDELFDKYSVEAWIDEVAA